MTTYQNSQQLICPTSPLFKPLKYQEATQKKWLLSANASSEQRRNKQTNKSQKNEKKSSIMFFLRQKQEKLTGNYL